jgi:hypothetical protein
MREFVPEWDRPVSPTTSGPQRSSLEGCNHRDQIVERRRGTVVVSRTAAWRCLCVVT